MGRMGEKVEITKYKLVDTNMHRDVKNSIGNGEAKELICTIHGHELKWGGGGMMEGRGVQSRVRIKGRKKWDNYNSIVNKIYV